MTWNFNTPSFSPPNFVKEPCRLCKLSTKTGCLIVGMAGIVMYIVTLVGILFYPFTDEELVSFSRPTQTACLVVSTVGLVFSLLLILGTYKDDPNFSYPWLIFWGLMLISHFVGFIYMAAHGLPYKQDGEEGEMVPNTSKIVWTFIILYLFFGVESYMFWIVLVHALSLTLWRTGNYEKFPVTDSPRGSSRPKKSRSPIFKLRDLE